MATDIAPPLTLQEPVLRWSARARSIPDVEKELSRIWAKQDLTTQVDGEPGRHVAARTSVMNLVVIARRPEIAERGAATIQALTGRHPSRTIVVQSADPDGPSWIDARIEAHCVLPRADAPETCAETIHLIAGGEGGRHLSAIVTPLIVHDLPVTIWWPGEPPFTSRAALDLFEEADRLVIDGSTWNGDGLARLTELASMADETGIAVSDFAQVRQSRWREAIASIFDDPDYLPYLWSLRRIAVTYGTRDETGAPGSTNVVKAVYHVAWLASRLGLHVKQPLTVAPTPSSKSSRSSSAGHGKAPMSKGMVATLSDGHREVAVVLRPQASHYPPGTTLRVELLCDRRGSELRADVTAQAESVQVRLFQDGVDCLQRHFLAARRGDVDLLAEAIESGGHDPVATGMLRAAARLVG
jgi:glucose-6-phosphate dehydrogenase assembly protein OpcA